MSKNPSIKEGGQAKQFTGADKIQTKLVGGGTQNWVPENEAGKYADVGTLYANKNGTYYSKSDKKDGYNKVVVKVAGSNGSARQDGKPSTLDGGDIAPGDIGSAVVGEDEDGNDAVVGVDKDGKLVKTPVPSSIEIIAPPTKTEYPEGATIIFDGLVVVLKKKDGSTFTDATYLNGHIPMGELIFPVEVATLTDVPVEWVSPYDNRKMEDSFQISVSWGLDTGPIALPIPHSSSGTLRAQTQTFVGGDGQITLGYLSSDKRRILYIHASTTKNVLLHVEGEGKNYDDYVCENEFSHNGKTVYWSSSRHTWMSSVVPLSPAVNGGDTVDENALTDANIMAAAWFMIYGGSSHTTESSSGNTGSSGGGTF